MLYQHHLSVTTILRGLATLHVLVALNSRDVRGELSRYAYRAEPYSRAPHSRKLVIQGDSGKSHCGE
jgi:hypothetical protein